MAYVDQLFGLGIAHETNFPGLILQIENLGEGPRGAGEGGMRSDVGDLLAVHPDCARSLESGQKFRSGACCHDVVFLAENSETR